MKRIILFALIAVMLFSSCGVSDDTTAGADITDVPIIDEPITDAPHTGTPDTNEPDTVPQETEPLIPKDDYKIMVKEDTYVFNKDSSGDLSNVNFGNENEIHVKSYPGSTYTRYGYLKFDISELLLDTGITAIELDLKLKTKQNSQAEIK